MPENTPLDLQVSEIELVYKVKIKPSQRPKIKRAQDAYEILSQSWNMDRINLVEEFKLLLLNRGNRVLGLVNISSGGITTTVVDLRLIFVAALKAGSINIIAVHSHPSGNLTPSEGDILITERIKQAGKIIDITLCDHIIITSEGYYSFAEEGML